MRCARRVIHTTLLAAAIAPSLLAMPAAADFYAGKSIDIVIGSAPGGGYDIYGRAIGRHLGRFIPGNPTIVPKNMPGAGSGRAAAFVYSVAPKDGTVIGTIFPGVLIAPLLDDRTRASYEPAKLKFLAAADNATRVCATFHTSKVKTYDDALKQKAIMGSSAPGSSTHDYVLMHRKSTGAQFELVLGYKGSNEVMLAMERGEVDGICGFDWASFKSQRPDWIRDRKVNVLVQDSLEPEPELTQMGVPQIWQFVRSENDKNAVQLIVSQQTFGRPFVAPPETPAAQVAILRAAFMATMQDKEFLADAEKTRIDINPSSGDKVQETVEKLYATPKAVIDRAKELIKP